MSTRKTWPERTASAIGAVSVIAVVLLVAAIVIGLLAWGAVTIWAQVFS